MKDIKGRDKTLPEESPEVRITDRRRFHLNNEDAAEISASDVEQPSLKPSYVEELEARTKAAEKQVQEVQARFDQLRQQLQRETDETRQRLNRAADERAAVDKARFISSLLPVIDDLYRAIQAAEEGTDRDAIVEGIRRIAGSFESALAAANVEPIPAVGETFDPELHEAVDTASVDPEDDGKVLEEYTRGFRAGDRLLRPARVRVGRAQGQAQKASE
ncbi:MAG TPA: nucleotide exchange factor GrpE [Pyrinomonadaceae bacterium]